MCVTQFTTRIIEISKAQYRGRYQETVLISNNLYRVSPGKLAVYSLTITRCSIHLSEAVKSLINAFLNIV